MPSPAASKRKDARQSMIDDIHFGDFDSSDVKREELVKNKFTIEKFVWKIECVNCKKEIYSLKKIGSNKVLKKDVFDMQTRVAGEHPAKYDTKTKLKMSFLEYNKMCEKRNIYRKAMGTKVFDPGLENAWLNDL